MTTDTRSVLLALGKRVSKEMGAGGFGDGFRDVQAHLLGRPDDLLVLLDLFVAQVEKPRANRGLVAALLLMLQTGFTDLASRLDRGRSDAEARADAIRRRLLHLGRETATPETMLILVDAMAQAKLDPGAELRTLMAELADDAAEVDRRQETLSTADLSELFLALVKSTKGDVFAFVEQMSTATRVMPDDHRCVLAVALAAVPDPTAREALPGLLSDPSPIVRSAVIAALERLAGAGEVSATMLRRLQAVRGWLPEDERTSLERVVDACSRAGLEPAPWPASQLERMFGTGIDGSGAQSLFIVVRDRRKLTLGNILLKRGVGVADAFVERGMSKGKLERLLDSVADQVDTWPASPVYVRAALGQALATGVSAGAVPPFALLEVAEASGFGDLRPQPLPTDVLVADLCRGIDPALLAEGSECLVDGSADWPDAFDFVQSWFEDDDEVEAVLSEVPGDDPDALDALDRAALDRIVDPRRGRWAETIAWSALLLREANESEPWEEFATVARELLAGRPATELPILQTIAAITVDAFYSRAGEDAGQPE